MFDNSKVITKEYLLRVIGEENIFKRYLGLDDVNEIDMFCNPLRSDEYPTATFKFVNDRIQFRDWSQDYSSDCFNVAQFVTREKTFYSTLFRIAVDFGLVHDYSKSEYPALDIEERIKRIREKAPKTIIDIQIKPWQKIELDFWSQFGITLKNLEDFNVYPISKAWINKEKNRDPFYNWKREDIGFAYYFGNGDYKLYFPFRDKRFRFIHNNPNVLQGYNNLPKIGSHCVITKSYKDVMALKNFNIVAVSPMSETTFMSDILYKELQSRFLNLFLLYDNDMPGKRAIVKIRNKRPELITLLFKQNEPKDFTDNLKVYGANDMADVVEDMKRQFL